MSASNPCRYEGQPEHECVNRLGFPVSGDQSCWISAREDILRERLLQRYEVVGDCWEWTGDIDHKGYGRVFVAEGGRRAHRVFWETFVGSVPEGLQLDHLCRNRRCVRPEHLEPVTCRENLARGNPLWKQLSERTHCGNGHEYTPENTRWIRDGRARVCRTCHAAYEYARKQRLRSAALAATA